MVGGWVARRIVTAGLLPLLWITNGGILRLNRSLTTRTRKKPMLWKCVTLNGTCLVAFTICAVTLIGVNIGHGQTLQYDPNTPGKAVPVPYNSNTKGEMRPIQMPHSGPCDWDPCLQHCPKKDMTTVGHADCPPPVGSKQRT